MTDEATQAGDEAKRRERLIARIISRGVDHGRLIDLLIAHRGLNALTEEALGQVDVLASVLALEADAFTPPKPGGGEREHGI